MLLSQSVGPHYEVLIPMVDAHPSGDGSIITERFNLVGTNLMKDEAFVVRIAPANIQDGRYIVSESLSKYCI